MSLQSFFPPALIIHSRNMVLVAVGKERGEMQIVLFQAECLHKHTMAQCDPSRCLHHGITVDKCCRETEEKRVTVHCHTPVHHF